MIKDLIFIAKKAGEEILKIYGEKDFVIEYKSDDSPLTFADTKANEVICDFLRAKFPNIKILSEENSTNGIMENEKYFIVDPLDGTKEFINRNGEFTVNIALIEKAEIICGVIYIPVWDEVYYAEKGEGAFLQKDEQEIKLPLNKNAEKVAVVSRSHSGELEREMIKKTGISKIVDVGSSIKFCWLAEGKVDLYVRAIPLKIWDLSAAYLICCEAGAEVKDFEGNEIDFTKITVPGIIAKRI